MAGRTRGKALHGFVDGKRSYLFAAKHAWRSATSFIGNLVSARRVGFISISVHCTRSNACSLDGTCLFEFSGKGESKTCCRAGDVLLPFALAWLRARKPPSTPDSFTAHPVPLSDFTSPNSRRLPPRRGREAMGQLKPRSRRPGIVSKPRQPKPRRPRIGRRSSCRVKRSRPPLPRPACGRAEAGTRTRQLICASGKSASPRAFACPALPRKIFRFFRNANQRYTPDHPVPEEGRCARHQRGAGCGGRGGCRKTSAPEADGEVVWS